MTVATYHDWSRVGPTETRDGVHRWYAVGHNFMIEMIGANAGQVAQGGDGARESCLVVPGGGAVIDVVIDSTSVRIDSEAFVVVPAGSPEIRFVEPGRVFRLVDRDSSDYVTASAVMPPRLDDPIAPIGDDVKAADGSKVIVYRLADYEHLEDRKRIFMSTNFMVNMVRARDTVRDPRDLSPHAHEDFQQATLVARGEFVHRIRRPWGRDSTAWVPDDYVKVGAPSVTLIGPGDVHTLQNVGTGPWQQVDVFSPPRRDFWNRGLVLNGDDYAFPEDR